MSFLFGNKTEKAETARTANVKTKDILTNQSAQPIPVLWGIRKVGGTYITDLFQRKSKAIKQEVGSGKSKTKVTTGYNYYASFALSLCMGPVDSIRAIYGNDDLIWSGNVARGGSDSAQIATSLGNIRIYWGTTTQPVDGTLASYGVGAEKMPAYRGICYAVAQQLFFGESTSPPNLTFVLERNLNLLPVSAHSVSDDAVIPEVIYDLLTSPVYGAAVPASIIDKDSFTAAGNQTITEDLTASPLLDSSTDMKSAMGDLLSYVNGGISTVNGKIHFMLQRAATGDVPSIGLDDMLEEPNITRPSWADTWSDTRLTFTDRDREFDSNVAVYSDAANAAIAGITQKEIQRPHVTRATVAMKIATAIGGQGGIPLSTVKLVLTPSAPILPGTQFNLTYPPLGILSLPLIAHDVTSGAPDNPRVEIEATEDTSRIAQASYVATPPALTVIPTEGPATAFMRIAALPSGLKSGMADGVLVCAGRPNGVVVGATIYTNWSLTETWKPETDISAFPFPAVLNRWKKYGSYWLLDVTLDSDDDQEFLSELRDQLATLYAVTCIRDFDTSTSKNQHDTVSTWLLLRPGGRFEPVGTRQWEIEVQGAQFGSRDLLPEVPPVVTPPTPSVPGRHPCQRIFLGRVDDFAVMPSDIYFFERSGGNNPSDTQQVRYFKTPTRTPNQSQALDDAPAQRFERLNTTMNPNGSLFDNWGAVVAPTTW